jgi:hypothetical protein
MAVVASTRTPPAAAATACLKSQLWAEDDLSMVPGKHQAQLSAHVVSATCLLRLKLTSITKSTASAIASTGADPSVQGEVEHDV